MIHVYNETSQPPEPYLSGAEMSLNRIYRFFKASACYNIQEGRRNSKALIHALIIFLTINQINKDLELRLSFNRVIF